MLKKLLIGCGLVLGLLTLIAVLGGVWVFSKAKEMGARYQNIGGQLQALNGQFSFTAPADGLMKEDRLVVWLGVLRNHGSGVDRVEQNTQRGGFKGVQEILNTIPQTGEQLALQLKSASMSTAEYRWILGQVVGTLRSGDARADAGAKPMVDLVDAASNTPLFAPRVNLPRPRNRMQNQMSALAAPVTSSQIAHNLQLLKKHQKEFLSGGRAIPLDGMLLGMAEGMGARGRAGQPPLPLKPATTPSAAKPTPAPPLATPAPAR